MTASWVFLCSVSELAFHALSETGMVGVRLMGLVFYSHVPLLLGWLWVRMVKGPATQRVGVWVRGSRASPWLLGGDQFVRGVPVISRGGVGVSRALSRPYSGGGGWFDAGYSYIAVGSPLP